MFVVLKSVKYIECAKVLLHRKQIQFQKSLSFDIRQSPCVIRFTFFNKFIEKVYRNQ